MSTKTSQKMIKPDPELESIAKKINEWFPLCRMAFSNFIGYRFMIGCALIRAKEIIPSAKPGPKLLNPKPGQPLDFKNREAYNEQLEGFLAWKRKNFPEISTRTLHNYCTFAMEVITAHPEMATLDLAALPEEQRAEVYAKLKACVSGKDVTLCLRSMNEIPEAQEPGGDRGGRRPTKSILDALDEAGQMMNRVYWDNLIKDLRREGIDRKSWKLLARPEQARLMDIFININNMIRAEFKGG